MPEQFSDAAKRCSDTVRLHITLGHVGKWIAIRLFDGGTDAHAYDTREDAIKHQLHEELCCYVVIPPDDMSPRSAERFMALHRAAYDAGMRFHYEQEYHAPAETLDYLRFKGIIP